MVGGEVVGGGGGLVDGGLDGGGGGGGPPAALCAVVGVDRWAGAVVVVPRPDVVAEPVKGAAGSLEVVDPGCVGAVDNGDVAWATTLIGRGRPGEAELPAMAMPSPTQRIRRRTIPALLPADPCRSMPQSLTTANFLP